MWVPPRILINFIFLASLSSLFLSSCGADSQRIITKPAPVSTPSPEDEDLEDDTVFKATDEKEFLELWKGVKIPPNMFEELPHDFCNEDPKFFYGCILMANYFLGWKEHKQPDQEKFKYTINLTNTVMPSETIVIFNRSGLSIFKTPEKLSVLNNPSKEEFKKFEMFLDKNKSYDFTPIFKFIRENVPAFNSDLGAAIRAEGMSVYFGTAYDPHSRVESSFQFSESQKSSDKEYAGIGALLNRVPTSGTEGKVFIKKVYPDSPAEKAGFLSGDEIISINRKKVNRSALKDCVDRLRGEKLSDVRIKIKRGNTVFVKNLKREPIMIENVSASLYPPSRPSTIFIKIDSFLALETCSSFENKFLDTRNKAAQQGINLDGVIIDVRDNGGGSLDQVSCIVGKITPRSRPNESLLVVSTRSIRDNALIDQTRTFEASINKLPVAVLINSQSASASEILAGNIQAREIGPIIGRRTFGKGTVQSVNTRDWADLGLSLILTKSRYFLPSGFTTQIVGVEPDIDVLPSRHITAEQLNETRESDLYWNTIPYTDLPWAQTKPPRNKIDRMKKCVASKSIADIKDSDLQLITAVEALKCWTELKLSQ